MDIDLSALTDDQLAALATSVAKEFAHRNDPVLRDVAKAMALDEREKAEILRQTTLDEIEKLRASERARVAMQAAEATRREYEGRSWIGPEEKQTIIDRAAEAEIARLRNAERMRLKAEAEAKAKLDRVPLSVTPNAQVLAEWARRKRIGLMIQDVLGPGWTLSVWRNTTETRVYIDKGAMGVDGKATYWATGSAKIAPGTLELKRVKADRKAVIGIAKTALGYWRECKAFSCDQAVAVPDIEAAPEPANWRTS